jgi:hypothetical protein
MVFNEEPTLNAKLTCNQIDAHEFFRQADNFGQDVLVADNLEGRLDAHLYIQAFFDQEGNFLEDKLHVLGGVGIKEGQLKDFAMLEDFSTFVDIRDLRDLHYELERLFGTVIELVEEPQDWRDIPEHQEDPNSKEPEFLDMEIGGGR